MITKAIATFISRLDIQDSNLYESISTAALAIFEANTAFPLSIVKDPVYRGEHGTSNTSLHSKSASLTFTNKPEVASIYAEEPNDRHMTVEAPRTGKYFINIINPIINSDDPFIDFNILANGIGHQLAMNKFIQYADYIYNTDNWLTIAEDMNVNTIEEMMNINPSKITELYMDIFPLLDDAEIIAALKHNGYDGAIHDGNGESSGSLEYRVFSVSQVKSAFTGKPITLNEDLSGSDAIGFAPMMTNPPAEYSPEHPLNTTDCDDSDAWNGGVDTTKDSLVNELNIFDQSTVTTDQAGLIPQFHGTDYYAKFIGDQTARINDSKNLPSHLTDGSKITLKF